LHDNPLSTYQRAILDWVYDGSGNGVVNAVAGSGKTSTLKAISRVLPSRGVFLAFNKHIADELGQKLIGLNVDVSTIHSVGFRALRAKCGRSMKVESGKYLKLIRDLLREAVDGDCGMALLESERASIKKDWPAKALRRIVDLLRLDLEPLPAGSAGFDYEASIAPIVDRHGIDLDIGLARFAGWACARILRQGLEMVRKGEALDFTDMLWACVVLGAKPFSYSWVLCDECQDLSPAQLSVALSCVYRNGRFLAVGDVRQAIYGFAGADSESVARIIETTNAARLPLNICYRCPTSHLDMARTIVPEIEPAPWAKEGEIESIPRVEVGTLVGDGDLVLCRTTAPLIRLCFELLSKGVSARVRGRDIGAALLDVLDDIEKQRGFRFRDFPAQVEAWESERVRRILKKNGGDDDDPAIQAIGDQAECLKAFHEWMMARHVPDPYYRGAVYEDGTEMQAPRPNIKALRREIEDLFSDERPGVWLSTVHRAKGLEADRVWILRPDLLPFPYARQPWQVVQEQNLRYVALTRAKKSLFFIVEEPKEKKHGK
jgi:superfamily I DNA/RNA helicase